MSLFGNQSTFGQPAAQTSSIFAPTSQPTTNFFQQPQQTQNPLSFGGTAASGSMFGQPAQQTQTSLFGGPPATTSTFSFGPTPAVPSFGTAAPGSTSLFGTQSSGFLSSAPPPSTFTSFQPAQRPPTQAVSSTSQMNLETIRNFTSALTSPQIYGDERDLIIARLNQLQAFCGTGKGYFQQGPPIEFTGENPCCRLKTVCYNRLSGLKDEDGLVTLVIKKNEQEIKNNLQLIIDALSKIMGSKPQLFINVETTKSSPDNNCEIVLFVTETGPTGLKKRIPASETYNFFNQPQIKQQLVSTLSVDQLAMKVDLSNEKMKEYMALPQAGIDPLLWQQAVADNPDPAHLIPYPVVGFSGLRERQKLQKIEIETHEACLKELAKRIEQIEEKLISSQSRLIQMKSSENDLSHRLLKVISMQLVQTRQGYALDSGEETLYSKLESVNSILNGSSQLKSRVAEILSHFRSRDENLIKHSNEPKNRLDDDIVLELKQYLRKCQDAAEKLINVVKNDSKGLSIVKEVLNTNNLPENLQR